MKKTIIFGITAGIAAYKTIDLIKNLKIDFNVEVILTKNASQMIKSSEFKRLGIKVHSSLFKKGFDYKKILKEKKVSHIDLSDNSNLMVIAPATASIIGKISNGIADDLLTTTVMATLSKVMVCPAMNVKMWQNPIVQDNIKKLRSLGYWIIEPEKGELACGYEGIGRLANIDLIEGEINKFFNNFGILEGKKVLVTAGGTSEYIDPVRIITNESSGKMGIYVAEEFAKHGADVTLIRANTKIEPNFAIKELKVKTSKEMFEAIKKNIKCDIIVHAAAVSDFTADMKRKKIDSKNDITLKLKKTIKIIDKIKVMNKNIFLVGFKAEYKIPEKELIDKAYRKLRRSNADLIIANDVGKEGRGFDVDSNEVYIVDNKKRIRNIPLDSKRIIAEKIVDEVVVRIK